MGDVMVVESAVKWVQLYASLHLRLTLSTIVALRSLQRFESGALDIMVVQHEDGVMSCTPFHVRFSKVNARLIVSFGSP